MSRKPDKAARRKAKVKAKRVHAEQLRHQQHVRIAAALAARNGVQPRAVPVADIQAELRRQGVEP